MYCLTNWIQTNYKQSVSTCPGKWLLGGGLLFSGILRCSAASKGGGPTQRFPQFPIFPCSSNNHHSNLTLFMLRRQRRTQMRTKCCPMGERRLAPRTKTLPSGGGQSCQVLLGATKATSSSPWGGMCRTLLPLSKWSRSADRSRERERTDTTTYPLHFFLQPPGATPINRGA